MTLNIEQAPASLANYTPGRVATVDRIVVHVAEGTYRGTLSWFQNPQAKVSAHFTVGKDGEVGQSVRRTDTAWHAGPVPPGEPEMNPRSIGIEHEGKQGTPPWEPTDAQLEASAQLVAMLCRLYRLPADRTHIIGHSEVYPGRAARANCPGRGWPWDRFLARVNAILSPLPADPSDERPVRIFSARTNTQLGIGTLVQSSGKVYLSPEQEDALKKSDRT